MEIGKVREPRHDMKRHLACVAVRSGDALNIQKRSRRGRLDVLLRRTPLQSELIRHAGDDTAVLFDRGADVVGSGLQDRRRTTRMERRGRKSAARKIS